MKGSHEAGHASEGTRHALASTLHKRGASCDSQLQRTAPAT